MTTRASFRLLRTGLIGSTILGLAAGGHLAGGGSLPEPAILVALCALTVLPVSVLTKFRLSMPVLAGLLGAGQPGCTGPSTLSPARRLQPARLMSGHAHHTPVPALDSFGAAPPAHAAAGDWQMFAAHAVATLATAVVLARGEQALWALAAWLRPLAQLPVLVHHRSGARSRTVRGAPRPSPGPAGPAHACTARPAGNAARRLNPPLAFQNGQGPGGRTLLLPARTCSGPRFPTVFL